MMTALRNYSTTLWALLCADFAVFKGEYPDKLINVTISVVTQIIVMLYIMPYFGLKATYTGFMVGAWLACSPLFEGYGFIANLVSDLSGEKKITYELLLPIPSWLVFVKMILSFALQGIASSIIIIPIAKLFLQEQLVLSNISIPGFITMFFVNAIFIGAFCLALSSMIGHMGQLETAYVRIMFPLWFLGGFNFSWHAIHSVFPRASFILLANPILYSNDGFRSALLSNSELIAVSICVPVLIGFTFLLGTFGILRLKKRLDFI